MSGLEAYAILRTWVRNLPCVVFLATFSADGTMFQCVDDENSMSEGRAAKGARGEPNAL